MKRFVNWFNGIELSLVTVLSKVVPLLVPVIPAYVGYMHVTNPDLLNFDRVFGLVYAGVIEGLGYAAIYKAVQFWENNKKYTEGSPNRAPLGVAVGIYVVYLIVTLAVNVVLDWVTGIVWYNVLALGLISILSIPAGLLMSISAIQTERENERTMANEERKKSRANRPNEQPNERPRTPARSTRTNRPNERTPNAERRTTIPQPVAEHENERTMGFPTDLFDPNERRQLETMQPGERIQAYIARVQERQNRIPGQSEIARAVNVSKSTADSYLKK